jgi:DNA processing protein
LALGIDAVAHRAALDAGGKTVAVLANGLNQIYPKSHRGLAIEILKRGGAIVSEQPDDMPPLKQHFVARNRIISGLCKAVIITEAGTDSGALHTANFATEQGRTVMVVPGNVTSTTSVGCNRLLRTGAVAVTDTVDVLQELDINAASATPVKAQSKEEQTILDLLAAGKNTSQELIEQSQLSAGQFANIISLMEITGKVRSLGAGQWMVR